MMWEGGKTNYNNVGRWEVGRPIIILDYGVIAPIIIVSNNNTMVPIIILC
jgi:hypothetical protein